jgi:hypothetical protein
MNIFSEAIKVQAHLLLKMMYDALGTRGMWNGILILLIPKGPAIVSAKTRETRNKIGCPTASGKGCGSGRSN